MARGWRKLHNEELRKLYSSPSIIRMIKSRRIRWRIMLQEWREEECMYVIGWESRRKETTTKIKT
jgi:hypothetical protein